MIQEIKHSISYTKEEYEKFKDEYESIRITNEDGSSFELKIKHLEVAVLYGIVNNMLFSHSDLIRFKADSVGDKIEVSGIISINTPQ